MTASYLPVTMREALRLGTARLRDAGIDPARMEAEVLLACICGLTREALLARLEAALTPLVWTDYAQVLDRRAGGTPLQYLTGHQEFMSLDFLVTPAVLIPRADTEVLVETVLELTRKLPKPIQVVDVGTGSGAVGVSLARYLPAGSRVWAVDLSVEALEVAQNNARRLGVDVTFVHGDLLASFLFSPEQDILSQLSKPSERLFDVVVANLPYIPTGELELLAPELACEPRVALDGGVGGLEVFRRMMPQAGQVLCSGGYLAMETGWDQAAAVAALVGETACFTDISIRRDYSGRDRVVLARRT